MKARTFSHVGITVSDFNKAVRFYWDVFGCPLVGVADSPSDRVRTFFGVDAPQPSCKIGWIRVGLTHISFNVRNLPRWYDHLVGKGVECVSRPERSPRGHSFFFCRDFDGNLIELMDLGHMYYVLGWLGPLGGWLFRRGMYKKYYL
jgi:catechol 2,3-dioxygenase-like lactoylglutathione lyase family enzyme